MKKAIIIVCLIALCAFIAGQAHAVSSIRPYTRPIPRHNHTVVIHEHKTDVLPYVVVGIIAGVVIHELAMPRCETGIICKRF